LSQLSIGIGEDPWAGEDLLGEVVDEREIVGEAGRGWEVRDRTQLTASKFTCAEGPRGRVCAKIRWGVMTESVN